VLRRRREEYRLPYFSEPVLIDNSAETDFPGSGIKLLYARLFDPAQLASSKWLRDQRSIALQLCGLSSLFNKTQTKESTMKFTTVVLASAFVVSGTFAFAQGYGNPNGSPGGRTSLSGTGPSTYGGGGEPGLYGPSVRRHYRRAGYGYGPGVVGAGVAGAAAVGTAAAVAATSPGWGWGGGPYYGGAGYQPAYYGGAGYQRGAWGPVSSKDYELYIKNLHDAGYDPKNNYNANGTIKVQ
jgi:hypothetical protein